MKNSHPIDDLFKVLAEAEVVPPASVWEKIAAQQSWSDRLLTSIRKYWWVPLLFLAVAGAGVGVGTTLIGGDKVVGLENESMGLATAHEQNNSEQGSTSNVSSNIYDPVDAATNENPASASVNDVSSGAAAEASVGTFLTDLESVTEREIVGGRTTGNNEANTSSEGFNESEAASATRGGAEDATGQAVAESVHDQFGIGSSASFLNSRRIEMIAGKASRPGLHSSRRPTGSAGSIPPGDWWIGGAMGYYGLEFSHDGTNRPLRDALNENETGNHSISIELLGGRIWRNGFFISTGIGTESMTTKFNFAGNQTLILDSTVYTPIGFDSTLQTVIYDTTMYQYGAEVFVRKSNTNRYNIFRIPVAVGWQKEMGRWELGPQVGLIGEFGTSRTGYSLAVNELGNDSLSAAGFALIQLDEPNINKRYGLGLSASASLHVGFKMSEYWSIWASPEYVTRIAGFSNAPVEFQADRIGLRFGFRYIIPY